MALELLETKAKERCKYFSREKTDDSKIHKKIIKIPGGKTANFGS